MQLCVKDKIAGCKVVEVFWGLGECRYVMTGGGTGGVYWGKGQTQEEARNECQKGGGETCANPIGGCNEM